MTKLAANLSMMFTELPYLERFGAAAECGFEAVEFLFPYEHPPQTVAATMKKAGVKVALFNLAPGDWDAGERGVASFPGREAEFEASVERAIEYARALSCPRVHAMAGLISPSLESSAMKRVYVRNLKHGAARCAEFGIELLIEPINRRDVPGYYLNTTAQAAEILELVGADNLRIQLDLYHVQITEGDLAHHIRNLAGRFTHVQIAGNPERNEPDRGEVDYPYVLGVLDESGFEGWVGCEYRPRSGTREGLGWARPYGIRA